MHRVFMNCIFIMIFLVVHPRHCNATLSCCFFKKYSLDSDVLVVLQAEGGDTWLWGGGVVCVCVEEEQDGGDKWMKGIMEPAASL